jgi:hypothetical protein
MLCKFGEQLYATSGGSAKAPPFVIRASDLDKNFGLCYPLPLDGNNSAYKVVRPANDGWRLEGSAVFDVCENGKPARYLFFAERLPE